MGVGTTLTSTKAYYMGGLYEVTDGPVKKYYSIAGQTVAVRDDSGLQYLLTDHLGSVVAVTNANGTLTSQQRYLPFGEVRTIPDSPITITDFGFTGQRDLGGTGLMDYRARFYSPALGRFTQPDTIIPNPSSPQSWNRYSYVMNSPVNLNDPSGHESGDMCDRGYRSCELETYTRAGIAMVSPYGNSRPRKPVLFFTYFRDKDYKNHTIGQGAITDAQMETERGKPIIDAQTGEVRSVGLGLRDHPCTVDGCDMDQNDPDVAVIAMRTRISLRLDACESCSAEDLFIVALLAADERITPQTVGQISSGDSIYHAGSGPMRIDWASWLDDNYGASDARTKNQELFRDFTTNVAYFQSQGYYAPQIDLKYLASLFQ